MICSDYLNINCAVEYSPQNLETRFQYAMSCRKGSILAVMGRSGSGKTTLLEAVAGFRVISTGFVLLNGSDITHLAPEKRPVNLLFQDHNLYSHLTLFENIAIGLNPSLELSDIENSMVMDAIEDFQLSSIARNYPHQVSGGQKQRAALARVYLRKRPLLLLDEPFSSLDPPLKREMLDLLRKLNREQDFTCLMVTHDFREALAVSDYSCFIADGKVLHYDRTDSFIQTADPRIKEYFFNLPH